MNMASANGTNGAGPDGGYPYPMVSSPTEGWRAAYRRADVAVNHALAAVEATGKLAAEMSAAVGALRSEMRDGFRQLGATVEATEKDIRKELESIPDVADDTASRKVADLRLEALQQRYADERRLREKAESEAKAERLRREEKEAEEKRLRSDRRFHIAMVVLAAALGLVGTFYAGHQTGAHSDTHVSAPAAH